MRRIILLMLANLAAGSVLANPIAANPQAAKRIVETVCVACHLADGNSVVANYPVLAGQHENYLYLQLKAFKSGARQDPNMRAMTASLSDQDMRNLAAYYSQQKPKLLEASDKTLIPLGEKIYRTGNAATRVPACMGCHGPSGKGIPVVYPYVGSQHATYILKQLTDFKGGTIRKSGPMEDIAARLSDTEMKAVAEYMSGLR